MAKKITVIPGDGIGKEITEAAVAVLKKTDEKFSLGLSYDYHDAGGTAYDKFGTPLPEETLMSLGAGFGSGAGTGELCGALSGAVMALDLLFPANLSDPVGSKKRAVQRARLLQQRFSERFGALRCKELLKGEKETISDAVAALGVSGHCAKMIATAVELTEELARGEGLTL